MNMKKLIKSITIPVALSILLVGCSESSDSEAVATVNGEKITAEEFDTKLKQQYGSEILDLLVTNKIIELEAKDMDISITEEEIDEEYKEYADMYGGEDSLLEVLSSYKMGSEDVKKDIETYLLTVKVMEDYVAITDEDVKTYFEENKETFGTPEQVEASHILVADEATASEVEEKLKAGEDFAELAKQHSTDTANAEKGGALGFFGRGEMATEFEDKAFSMNDGDVSEPVKTEFGFHIIKVTDKKEAKEATFEESKEVAREALLEQRVNEQYSTWVSEKMEEYEVENKLFQ